MTELQVIGAGLGRTGTLSLKYALEILGFDPCHHMKTVITEQPERRHLWKNVAEGDIDKLKEIFKGFKAAVDYPGCMFFEQFMEWNPEAKVVLSIRDNPDIWEVSCRTTVFNPDTDKKLFLLRNLPVGPFAAAKNIDKIILATHGVSPAKEETDLKKMYNEWNQHVIDKVPADKLLIFNVKEGWKPLCEFLGVPVPDEAFPRVNDRQEFINRTKKMRNVEIVLELVVGAVVVGALAAAAMYFNLSL